MGKLKRHIQPSDITINIRKGAPVPEFLIHEEMYHFPGSFIHKLCVQIGSLHVSSVSLFRWAAAGRRYDNTVTCLAFWNDPITQKDFKYVFLAASSALKGQSDKEKYEKSRKLKVEKFSSYVWGFFSHHGRTL